LELEGCQDGWGKVTVVLVGNNLSNAVGRRIGRTMKHNKNAGSVRIAVY